MTQPLITSAVYGLIVLNSLLPGIFSPANAVPLAKQVLAKQTTEMPRWQYSVMNGSPSLRASAVSPDTLWVAGTKSSVFISENQGKSWKNVSLKSGFNGDIRDIEIFDSQTAIIMTAGSGEKSRLYKTTDKGKHWQLLYKNREPEGFFNSIAFWDEKNGLIQGDPVNDYYTILRTTDGGKTWARIQQKNIPRKLKNEAAFAASGNTLITGEKGRAWFTTGGFSASIYSSTDSGRSWERTALPLHHKTQTAGGYALTLNQKKEIFVCGGDYKNRSDQYTNLVYLPAKKNSNWKTASSHNKGLRTAMSCFQQTCLLTGKTGTEISSDHGINWRVYSDDGFYTMASHNNLFLAAGDKGKVGVLNVSVMQNKGQLKADH